MAKRALIQGGKPIRVKVSWFTRGRYVKAADLTAIRELCDLTLVTWQRMAWGSCPFEKKVRAIIDRRPVPRKGTKKRKPA